MNKYFFIAAAVFCSQLAIAQKHFLSGRVIDSVTGEPLIYASIQIEGSESGTATGLNGNFTIELSNRETILVVSYVSYITEKVVVSAEQKEITIRLSPLNYLLQEISVYSKQKNLEEVSLTNLQNKQIKIFTGMTKDALRSIQLLPGVSANNETSAKINVRGGSTDENLVLINGVEVNEPYHFKEVQMASVGIFNIDMVNKIDFSAGGFSAEYGNALSSIMRIDYSTGDRNNYKAKADVSMVDLSLLCQGPIDSMGSFTLGLRKSYLEYLLRLLKISSTIYIAFYDVQGQVDYSLSPLNKLKFYFIYSKDDGDEEPTYETKYTNTYWKISGKNILSRQRMNDYTEAVSDFSNTLLSATSSNTLSKNIIAETTLSYYNEYNNVSMLFERTTTNDFKDYSQYWAVYSDKKNRFEELVIKTFSVKQDIMFQASSSISLKAGLVYRNINYLNDRNLSEKESLVSNTSKFPEITTTIYPPNLSNNDTTHLNTSSFRIEGYVQQTWQISDRMFFSSGLRFDYFDLNKGAKVSPRTSLTYKASDNLTLRAAWGIFFQPPSFNQLKSSIASEHNTNFQKAFHYILGAEKYFSNDVSLKLEGYYKSYSELIPVNRRSDGVLSYPSKENNSEGYAAGFDFQFTVNFGNINFWLSYGYLVAREKSLIDNLGYFPRYTDQTHTLSAVSSYDIGSGWSINLRAFCGSGFAYTPSNIVYDSKSFIYKWISASKNSGHFPSYERVDVRITKEIDVFGKPLQIYIDAMNVFGRKNVISIRYAYDEIGLPKVVENLLYGLIPTLGISYSF